MKYITTINNQEYTVEIIDETHIIVDGKPYEVDFESIRDQPVFSLLLEGKSYEALVNQTDGDWEVHLTRDMFVANVIDERERRLLAASGSTVAQSGEYHLKAPMPGLIVDIAVESGQTVEEGDVLIILESMKMQNELRAPRAGTITRVRVKSGESVEGKQTLLSLE